MIHDIRNTSFFILIILLLIGCNHTIQNDYKCADVLSDREIDTFRSQTLKAYSDDDLDKLADITTSIATCNVDTAEFEVFYNSKKDNFLAIDIYGLESEKQIDFTVCSLKSDLNLHLPASTILLFHKYTKDLNDGGIIVGLKLKKY